MESKGITLLVVLVAFTSSTCGWEMRTTWRHDTGRSHKRTLIGNKADEICKNPTGDSVVLCRQLESYKAAAGSKEGTTSTSIIAVLTGDKDSKSRELKLIEKKREEMADMVQMGITGAKYAVDTLEKAAEKLEKLKTYAENAAKTATKAAKLMKTASKALGALGTVASVCGPIGAGIGAVFSFIAIFVPQPDPNEKIMEQLKEGFEQMHDRFDKIDNKLDEIEFVVEKTAVYQMYKENQDRIHKLMFSHRQLFANPSEEALKEFIDMCRLENPLYALEWIHRRTRESRSPLGLQLFATIAKDTDYDRRKMAQFYEIIAGDMMTAAYLREACLGAQSPGNTKLIWRSRRVTGNLLSGISNAMKSLESQLASAISQSKLRDELATILDMHTEAGAKPQTIVADVKAIMSNKYYWLNWYVYLVKGSFDVLDGGDSQYVTVQGKKNKDLTLVLVWTEPNAVVEKEVDFCRSTYDKPFMEQLYYLLVGFDKLTEQEYLKRLNIFLQSPADFIQKGQELWKTVYHEATYFKNRPSDFRANKIVLITKADNVLANVSDASNCDLQMPMRGLRAFVTYYKSPTVHNTFGCLATGEQLDQLKVGRLNVCPMKPLQEAVRSHVRKLASEKKWGQAADAAKEVRDALQKSFSDLKWSVVAYDAGQSFWGCNNRLGRVKYEYQNCTWLNTTAHSFVISWSSGSDKLIQRQISEAEKKIKFLQTIFEKNLIFENVNDTQNLQQHVYDLITDPLGYFTSYGISEEKIAERIKANSIDFGSLADGAPLNPENVLNLVNFYENKVVSVGAQAAVATNADLTSLKLNPPQDKKNLQGLTINVMYYKPYESANTLHCTVSDDEWKQTGLGDREVVYGC